ncbi:RNA-binding protein [Salix suchowensis]|nr:RNA-binding protein [Salix suchowensis]
MAYPQYHRSQFGDTTFTKVFVGGLAWETRRRNCADTSSRKSKGYGFVTFRDPESARRACAEPNPVIDGRRANCNIASHGRPRPSPPRGRPQGGNPYQRSAPSYGGVAASFPPPPPLLLLHHHHYLYPTYSPDYGYHQAMYNTQIQQPTQYYHQMYGTSSSSTIGAPYYYGYSLQAPRAALSGPQAQRMPGPSYLYFPTSMEGSFSSFPSPTIQPTRHPFPSSSTADSPTPQQITTETETEAGSVTSESPNI